MCGLAQHRWLICHYIKEKYMKFTYGHVTVGSALPSVTVHRRRGGVQGAVKESIGIKKNNKSCSKESLKE